MTEKEIVSIIRRLKAYYPYIYRDITTEEANEIVDAWKTQIGHIDYEVVKKAVDKWGGQKEKAPTIAEFKKSLFDFYLEYDMKYSEVLKEKADQKEIDRIFRIRNDLWDCKAR